MQRCTATAWPRCNMRASGISQLAVLGDLRGSLGAEGLLEAELVSRFSATFPDQSDWLSQLASALKCCTIGALIRQLGYASPPNSCRCSAACICLLPWLPLVTQSSPEGPGAHSSSIWPSTALPRIRGNSLA